MQKNRDKKQALKFNSLVLGIQNYYKKAIMYNRDFVSIGYKINKGLYNRIGKSSYKKDALYTKLYPKYNYRVWNIQNITLFTIQACKFKIPKFFSNKPKIFEKSIEKLIEKQLDIKNDNVDCDWEKMRAIVRMKYNSKCVMSGEYLTGNNGFHIHHIIPKKYSGIDEIDNLVLLKPEIHTKLHSKEANEFYKTNKIYQNLLKTVSRFK